MAANGNSSDQQLLQQTATFIQHSLPGLDPGRYQVSVQQFLNKSAADGGGDISGEGLPEMTRSFGVTGPRFQLDQNAILSIYPPANSEGAFSNSLAHVVLNQKKLPWLFSPYTPDHIPEPSSSSYTTTINGKTVTCDYDEEVPTWMGVLLLSATDLQGADLHRVVQQGTVLDLVPTSLQMTNPGGNPLSGNLSANGYSLFSHWLDTVVKSPLNPGVGLSASNPIQYIDVPVSLFNTLAPSMADLNLMAHVREVDMAQKPITSGQQVDPKQQYGLVMGNRLPESQPQPTPGVQAAIPPLGSNLALLVSYEAMERSLRGHAGSSYFDTHVANNPDGFVRLVVLYQWTFTALEDSSFAFETISKSLNGRDPKAKNTLPFPNPQLRVPNPPVFSSPDNDQTVVEKMLTSGYFPMNHLARIPSAANNAPIRTLSWYRGPLVPYGAYTPSIAFMSTSDPKTAKPTTYAADQLLRYDPDAGQYDVSYALAWELGRLLSLQNKDFSVALFQWKKQVAMQYRMLLESQVLNDMYDNLLQLYKEIDADEQANQNARHLLHKTALLHLTKLSAAI